MVQASILTIGDEILIGQIVDTNSANISRALGSIGVKVSSMLSKGDDRNEILNSVCNLLENNDIVIITGGLGPTKDDITKDALRELFGAKGYVLNENQMEINRSILHSRGLDSLEINKNQAMVPEGCRVIPNRIGTAPIMVFDFSAERFGHKAIAYSLPGVPFETEAALPDIVNDIKHSFNLGLIFHRTVMTYGIAESALSEKISQWEDALPENIHLAYLPNPLTGVRLRLSAYGCTDGKAADQMEKYVQELKTILGRQMYATEDSTLEHTIGKLLKGTGETLSAAESCTGGEIAHLLTTVSGSSEYFLGSVTSYAIPIKEKVLNVDPSAIKEHGVVSSEVAAQMAEGVRNLTSSTYSVSTTGLAEGADDRNPAGTVWIGVSGPEGTITRRFQYHNDRKRNIERFAASALDLLRNYILDAQNQ